MLKGIWFGLSIFLIFIILVKMPQDTIGLSTFTFTNKTDILGSPTSIQESFNYIILICVLLYFGLAFFLDVSENF